MLSLFADNGKVEGYRDLYKELELMSNVGYHPNLINLIGAVSEEGTYKTEQHVIRSVSLNLPDLAFLFENKMKQSSQNMSMRKYLTTAERRSL